MQGYRHIGGRQPANLTSVLTADPQASQDDGHNAALRVAWTGRWVQQTVFRLQPPPILDPAVLTALPRFLSLPTCNPRPAIAQQRSVHSRLLRSVATVLLNIVTCRPSEYGFVNRSRKKCYVKANVLEVDPCLGHTCQAPPQVAEVRPDLLRAAAVALRLQTPRGGSPAEARPAAGRRAGRAPRPGRCQRQRDEGRRSRGACRVPAPRLRSRA